MYTNVLAWETAAVRIVVLYRMRSGSRVYNHYLVLYVAKTKVLIFFHDTALITCRNFDSAFMVVSWYFIMLSFHIQLTNRYNAVRLHTGLTDL